MSVAQSPGSLYTAFRGFMSVCISRILQIESPFIPTSAMPPFISYIYFQIIHTVYGSKRINNWRMFYLQILTITNKTTKHIPGSAKTLLALRIISGNGVSKSHNRKKLDIFEKLTNYIQNGHTTFYYCQVYLRSQDLRTLPTFDIIKLEYSGRCLPYPMI